MSHLPTTYRPLTPAEQRFVTHQSPFVAQQIMRDATLASSEATKRYPDELHNGRGDAFRHAYWSALMTKHCGEAVAKKFGHAHEASPPGDGKHLVQVGSRQLMTQPGGERAMDEHNNQVGRQLGLENAAASEMEIAAIVARALDDGRLIVLDRSTGKGNP